MAKFETISKYAGHDELIPIRKTQEAAGYDFVVAEDTLIPPYEYLMSEIVSYVGIKNINEPMTLEDIAKATKAADAKVTLVPTGVKCKLDPGTYLELTVRSSCPLKHWLILGNGVGVIDGDYYNNEDNAEIEIVVVTKPSETSPYEINVKNAIDYVENNIKNE